jgi:fructoselysine-6-P-deglycase FrlB-like protein
MDSLPLDYVPELRRNPPWLMDEMVAAEPGLVNPVLHDSAAGVLAEQIKRAANAGGPITVVGCGTSETASMGVADLLTRALNRGSQDSVRITARQALEAALDPWPGGYCLGVSHEGGTRATILAMDAARGKGARIGLLTGRSQSAGIAHADDLFVTPLTDRSWCHTVGYLSPMLAGTAIAEAISRSPLDVTRLEAYLNEVLTRRSAATAMAKAFSEVNRIIVVGAGLDRSPAREVALKIEEGVRLPARMLELETLLHGHLASCDSRTGLLLISTGGSDRAVRRARLAVQAAGEIGMAIAGIVSPAAASQLTPQLLRAGVIRLPDSVDDFGPIGRLSGAALSLQLLTLELAGTKGLNPDLIGRDRDRYRKAAAVAESDSAW